MNTWPKKERAGRGESDSNVPPCPTMPVMLLLLLLLLTSPNLQVYMKPRVRDIRTSNSECMLLLLLLLDSMVGRQARETLLDANSSGSEPLKLAASTAAAAAAAEMSQKSC